MNGVALSSVRLWPVCPWLAQRLGERREENLLERARIILD